MRLYKYKYSLLFTIPFSFSWVRKFIPPPLPAAFSDAYFSLDLHFMDPHSTLAYTYDDGRIVLLIKIVVAVSAYLL